MAREPVDYYAVLQVNPTASLAVIEAAYHAVLQGRAVDGHPPDPVVDEAYQVLSDAELRNSYDRWYVNWTTTNPEQVRAAARRRAYQETARRARSTGARLVERSVHQGDVLRSTAADSAGKAKKAAGVGLEGARRAREARRARAREKTGWRRRVALHPILALLAGLLAVALLVAAVAVPLQVVADRAEREEQRLAEVAAQEEAARVAAEEEAARIEAEQQAAEAAEREAEEARAAEEAEAQRKAEEERAAEEAEAQRKAEEEAEEAAKAECLERLADGDAELVDCDFAGEDLTGTNFAGRDLTGVSFDTADLTGAVFDDAVLQGTTWRMTTCPDGSRSAGVQAGCADFFVDPGDAERPLAIGEPATVGDWTVTVTAYQADAQSTARAVDWINNPPGEGFVYAIVGLSVTYDGTGQNEIPGGSLDVAINDVAEGDPDTSCSLPELDGQYDSLNTGQSTAYEICMYLPVETATEGLIGVYDGYSFESDEPTAHWAIP